ncbi:MAG: hypothetical protein HY986_09550 [Candidatus Melainabacteria bacterium]|nr:hypothetical protein [Candidatus Melainabacteria bacterium]
MRSNEQVFENLSEEVVPDNQVQDALEKCFALKEELATMPARLDLWMSGAARRERADKLLAKFSKAVDALLAALESAGQRPAQSVLLPLADAVKRCSDSLEKLLSYTQRMGTNHADTIHFLIRYNQEE